MNSGTSKLIKISSEAIRKEMPNAERLQPYYNQAPVRALLGILQQKNGFYAFESALHVLSDQGNQHENGLWQWNQKELWRSLYDGIPEDSVFFAEDVFGIQFCVHNGGIATFDPETGAFETITDSTEKWVQLVLDDYEYWTGFQIAHDWQKNYGPIPFGMRLVPVIPFVLGGEYVIENLHVLDATQGMRVRALIAAQIRDIPDGTKVNFGVGD